MCVKYIFAANQYEAMRIYNVSFLKNKVLSVKETDRVLHFDGQVFYEEKNGQLIFAIVKAENPVEAEEIAQSIANKLAIAGSKETGNI